MILFIALSSYLNASFVFKVKLNKFNLIAFALIIIIQLFLGSLIIKIAVENLLFSKLIAPFINFIILTPLKYYFSKYLSSFL